AAARLTTAAATATPSMARLFRPPKTARTTIARPASRKLRRASQRGELSDLSILTSWRTGNTGASPVTGGLSCPPSGVSPLPRDGLVAANRQCLTVDGAGGPVGAGFLAEGGDGGLDGGVEVARVDRAGQAVAFDLAPYRVLELGKYQARVLGVQRLVEFFEHVGGGGVH